MASVSILVVEDENIVAKDIVNRLRTLGYDVVASVSSGEEAIRTTADKHPDMVLMDIMLKGEMDGIQAAHEILARFATPVVYLTAYADEKTLQRAKVTEAFGYLLKPFEERELHITIEMALYKHKMEQRLRESEEQYRLLTETSRDIILSVDLEGRVAFVNRAGQEILGYQEEEMRGRAITDFAAGQEIASLEEHRVSQQLKDQSVQRYETVLISKATRRIPIEVSSAAILRDGETVGMLISARDITKRKEAEERLRESNLLNESLLATIPFGMDIVDERGTILYVNDNMEAIFGTAKRGEKCWEVYRMDKRQCPTCPLRKGVEIGKTDIQEIDGAWGERIFQVSHTGMLYQGKRVMLEIFQDVTERRRTEDALRRSEERFRGLTESTSDWIWEVDADGRYTYASPRVRTLLGYEPEEVIGRTAFDFMTEQEVTRVRSVFEKARSEATPIISLENQNRRKDGTLVVVETSAVPIRESDNRVIGFRGIDRDVTDRKRLEEQLHQAQKMESLGTLASGIAHDFNNVLNNVLGFAMQLKKYTHDQAKVKKYSETIEKSASRGAQLASQLLSFARMSKRENFATNLQHVIAEVVAACSESFPPNVIIEQDVDPELRPVLGDHGELYQVLLNLCINARDATAARLDGSPGGVVRIEARNAMVGEDINAQLFAAPGKECVELKVVDNGTGIPKDIREKIFDPFFTTKERGRGTGLGLSIVYNIVRSHQGSIVVDSEPGLGSAFRIFLPSVTDKPASTPVEEQEALKTGDQQLILLVDDETAMQELGRELLEEQGYRVIVANDGLEALQIYKARGKEIALVVLDLVMPGMDGGQAFVEMKEINPKLKAFFCTGYISDQMMENLLAGENLRALSKPFKPGDFLRMVHDVLESDQSTGTSFAG